MEGWIWLIAWTILMYIVWVYLYRSWKRRRKQRQEYLWQQVGFHPNWNHQAGKTGIAIDQAARRVALRDQNNLGVFEAGDIVLFGKSMASAGYTIDLRIQDPRKPDWRVAFGQDEQNRDAFYAHLRSLFPEKEAPGME